MNTSIEFKEVVLEGLKHKFQYRFGDHMSHFLEVRSTFDQMSNEFLIELETSILQKKEISSYQVSFTFPLNWFEHFKERIAPNWYKKKYPVKYKKHIKILEIEHSALFPDLNIPEKFGRIIISTKNLGELKTTNHE